MEEDGEASVPPDDWCACFASQSIVSPLRLNCPMCLVNVGWPDHWFIFSPFLPKCFEFHSLLRNTLRITQPVSRGVCRRKETCPVYPENNNNNLLKEIHIFLIYVIFFNICCLLLQIQTLLLWGLCLEFFFFFLNSTPNSRAGLNRIRRPLLARVGSVLI